MSFKAKDLHFDNTQPAFLQRLRGELTSGDTARHEQPIARNKRLKSDDDHDEPTYVLEDTKESLTKQEYEALIADEASKHLQNTSEPGTKKDSGQNEDHKRDRIAEPATASKKRKAVKIISGEDEDGGRRLPTDTKTTTTPKSKKLKKKGKAIKLTFDTEEGD